ncbi:hypothetical protein BKA65DRAFT_464130 [Rhexocercosporidium sp. MPI-PUGE-AT-0058]|nr:hypothetical protein BKA65DRAFT_464130 [Rhexocercosporidium sp. MPI-PUGE-AT-0058]
MASSQPANPQPPADAATGENGQHAPLEQEVWDEERLEKAMKTLKEMHIQLRGLRTTVPRMIAPLTTKHPSPETLFREFSKSANTANQEVQQFRRVMTAEESREVMEQARKSRAENPKGIKPWRATEHPDWLKKDT